MSRSGPLPSTIESALQQLREQMAGLDPRQQAELNRQLSRLRPAPFSHEQHLLDELPGMVWLADRAGRAIFFNRAWLDFTGRALDEELGEGWRDGLFNEDRPAFEEQIRAAFAQAAPFEIETRLRHHSGQYLWVQASARPLFDLSGKLEGYLGLTIDLHEHKRLLQALGESETRFQALFEHAPDGVVVVNERGQIVLANQRLTQLFGYTLEELLGRPIEILMPGAYRARHHRHVEHYMEAPRVRPMGAHLDLHGQHKSGRKFPVDITLGHMDSGGRTLVLATVRDITERRQMEAELAEVQRLLLESAEIERLTFSRELHDGPMQDLYALIYQLQAAQNTAGGELRDQLAGWQADLEAVNNELRAISGALRPPALTPYGLEKTLRSHIEAQRSAHPEVEFQTELTADQQQLPERIRLALFRIYQNAVSNALRHGQASRVRVRFDFDEEQIVLEVEDNGCGFQVPARWLELVREGHFGLAGSFERAQSIGAQMEVHSQPGQGTLIRVSVPRREEEQVAPRERYGAHVLPAG